MQIYSGLQQGESVVSLISSLVVRRRGEEFLKKFFLLILISFDHCGVESIELFPGIFQGKLNPINRPDVLFVPHGAEPCRVVFTSLDRIELRLKLVAQILLGEGPHVDLGLGVCEVSRHYVADRPGDRPDTLEISPPSLPGILVDNLVRYGM